MYRDDVCAVCGESLPPDHFYCREHGAQVDDRLHRLASTLARVAEEVPRLAALLDEVAQETWDWLAEQHDDEPDWPPAPTLRLRVHAEDIDVDVDAEPGQVRLEVATSLAQLLDALAVGLAGADVGRFAAAAADAEGANATH